MQTSVPSLPLQDNGKASLDSASGRSPSLRWRHRLLLALGLLALGAALGAYLGRAEPRTAPGLAAESTGAKASDVVALGRLMPRGDRVIVAPPFGAGDSRIARLLVSEGQHLQAGQRIAELDSLPMLKAAAVAAEARLAAEQAALARARANTASSLREGAADVERARAGAVLARSQAQRQRALYARNLVSKAALDEAEAREVQSARELDRAEALWQRQRGADAQPDVALAIRQVEVAEQALAQARADLERGVVRAPFAGSLITLHARVGEKPGSEGIASFGDLSAMQAELEVYQTDIARVALGQAVRISSPALATPLQGTVERIGIEVERQGVLSSDPAANTDARVVRVRVSIDAADLARAARLTGLEITARLQAAS